MTLVPSPDADLSVNRPRILVDRSPFDRLAGVVGGLLTGTLVAAELVKVLNGIFDPPPQRPAIPWTFVGALLAAVLATATVATSVSARWAGRVDASRLRDL